MTRDGGKMHEFNGLGMNLGNLPLLSRAESRSISAENFTGEKGKGGMATEGTGARCARELGLGWKVSPSIFIEPGDTYILADIAGPGAVQSIWTAGSLGRDLILRMYWDDQEQPSVECPLPDFFGLPWALYSQINSVPVSVNPKGGLNCFWEMPFRERCKITLENIHPNEKKLCYYQINYTLTDVMSNAAYFHAQFRRINPLPYGNVYTILDNVQGRGHYIGTSMGWGINNNGWWGEGEIKFFLDGDKEFPTICGTGTEDYFGGAWNWDVNDEYVTYSTPFLGMHQVLKPDGLYQSQHRHSMYRWHVMDPIRFQEEIRVTIQALGWRSEHRYLPGQHDICSVAYWYQTLPTLPFPKFPDRNQLEIL
jgi:hypothetical protein